MDGAGIHPGTPMELGLLRATDGAMLGGEPQGKTGAWQEKGPGMGEKIFISCVREWRGSPGGRGLVKGISW